MFRRRNDAGLSRVDLLVILACIGFVFLLAVPLLGRQRESSRRETCALNLKSIATALHRYHDSFQELPASASYKDGQNLGDKRIALKTVVPGLNGSATARAPYSFLVKLLPYLEKNEAFKTFDSGSHEAFDKANLQFAAIQVSMFLCPTFGGSPSSMARDYAGPEHNDRPAITNYKALGATTLACLQEYDAAIDSFLNGGILHPYAAYSLNAVKDPTRTAILVETKEKKYAAWWDGTTACIPGFHPGIGNVKDDRETSPPKALPGLNRDSCGGQMYFMTTAQFAGREPMRWGPSSDHPGVVMHAFGGTETRAIQDDVDPIIYSAIVSRRAEDTPGSLNWCHGK